LNRRLFGFQRSVDFLALVLYDFTRVVFGKAFFNAKKSLFAEEEAENFT